MKGARPFENDDEIRKFMGAIRGSFAARDRAIAALGLKCGGRISAILSLKIMDVSQDGRFTPRIYFRWGTMKGKREGQSLPLHPMLKMALGRWLVELRRRNGGLDPDGFLFASRKGSRTIGSKSYWEIMAKASRTARLAPGTSTHTFRKTVAYRVYEASGHCMLTVGKVLCQKSILEYLSKSLSYSLRRRGPLRGVAILGLY